MTFKIYYEKDWEHVGESALCIFGVHTKSGYGTKHPYDPDDLTRCFQCLRMITRSEDYVKWKNKIEEVCLFYSDSKQWKWIFDNFEKLYISYFNEYNNTSMPKTYKLMCEMEN